MQTMTNYPIRTMRLELVCEPGADKTENFAIKMPSDAAVFLGPLGRSAEERFVMLSLNARHEVTGLMEVSHGTISSSLVHPREVFKRALLDNSYAIIVAHNHPSGSRLFASEEDLNTTEKLVQGAELLGLNILDHLILGPAQEVYSIRENHPDLWKPAA